MEFEQGQILTVTSGKKNSEDKWVNSRHGVAFVNETHIKVCLRSVPVDSTDGQIILRLFPKKEKEAE